MQLVASDRINCHSMYLNHTKHSMYLKEGEQATSARETSSNAVGGGLLLASFLSS
jgi:hypothetical protein